MNTCEVEGCERTDIRGRGLCGMHYQRWWRYGDTGPPEPYVSGRNHFRLPKGEAARNYKINGYKQRAKEYDREWSLTVEQCEELFKGNCYYCGDEPSQVVDIEAYNGSYTYNGIDRVDNDKGYTPDNTVSCCSRCNEWKRSMSKDEFIRHCKKIVASTKQPNTSMAIIGAGGR